MQFQCTSIGVVNETAKVTFQRAGGHLVLDVPAGANPYQIGLLYDVALSPLATAGGTHVTMPGGTPEGEPAAEATEEATA